MAEGAMTTISTDLATTPTAMAARGPDHVEMNMMAATTAAIHEDCLRRP